jgi:hypothetical protein
MSEPTWTVEELRRFDRLTLKMSSRNQVTRIDARIAVSEFEKEHGHEKCKAMFEFLRERDRRKKRGT